MEPPLQRHLQSLLHARWLSEAETAAAFGSAQAAAASSSGQRIYVHADVESGLLKVTVSGRGGSRTAPAGQSQFLLRQGKAFEVLGTDLGLISSIVSIPSSSGHDFRVFSKDFRGFPNKEVLSQSLLHQGMTSELMLPQVYEC